MMDIFKTSTPAIKYGATANLSGSKLCLVLWMLVVVTTTLMVSCISYSNGNIQIDGDPN